MHEVEMIFTSTECTARLKEMQTIKYRSELETKLKIN